ncbi:MAG: OmpP1/FadL family transporter [Calditrichota bacterium]
MTKRILLGLAMVILSVSIATAQVSIPEQLPISTGNYSGSAARPLGLAGTYTGIADDYSSIWWNPAGLAQVKRIELQASVLREGTKNETDYFATSREGTASNFRLNNLGMVFPVPVYQGALSFAFGYSQVYGFDGRTLFASSQAGTRYWDDYDELIEGRLGMWSLAGAVDITPNLALGLGLNYWTGLRDYSRTAYYTENGSRQYTESTINADISAWGANVGGLFRIGRYVRAGLMLQTPMSMAIDEEWAQDNEDGYFNYRMTYPAVIRLGASVAPGRWLVAADLEYRDWTAMEFRSDTPYSGVGKASANQQIKDDYQATTRLSLGGEYLFPAFGLRLRGGYAYEPSNYKPAGSDADRNIFAFGVGVLIDRSVMLDAGLQFASFQRTSSDGSTDQYNNPIFNLKEDVSKTTALVTLSYRM